MLTEIQMTRLKKLHEVLSKKPERDKANVNKFEMSRWARRVTNGTCSTAACALGTAALHPWFRRQGLYIEWGKKYAYDRNSKGKVIRWVRDGSVRWKSDPVNDEDSFQVACAFFGITYKEAEYLFSSGEYPKDRETGKRVIHASHVAKRVKELIAKYEKEAAEEEVSA